MRVALDGNAECSAQSQIRDFQRVGRVFYQQILRFKIPVHHAVLVTVCDAFDELIHEILHWNTGISMGALLERCIIQLQLLVIASL